MNIEKLNEEVAKALNEGFTANGRIYFNKIGVALTVEIGPEYGDINNLRVRMITTAMSPEVIAEKRINANNEEEAMKIADEDTVKLREALLPLVNKFDEEFTKVLAEFGYQD